MKYLLPLLLFTSIALPSVASAALTDNITAYWKLDESSGNASDTVGSNTMVNGSGLSYTTGKINNSISANGSVGLTGSVISSATTNFTMAGWVFLSGTSLRGSVFHNGSPGTGSNNGIGLCVSTGASCGLTGNRLTAQLYGIAYVDTGTDIGTGWHYLAVTRNTTTLKFYIDCVQTANTSGTAPLTPTSASSIGGDESGAFFTGAIDEVGFWNRELSSAELCQLYNGGAGFQYPFGVVAAAVKSIISLLGVTWLR